MYIEFCTERLENTMKIQTVYVVSGASGSVVVKELYYKPEGHGFETR
jgi:hypothetical protein